MIPQISCPVIVTTKIHEQPQMQLADISNLISPLGGQRRSRRISENAEVGLEIFHLTNGQCILV